jgi:nicotinamidase-related amidase
MNFSSLGSSYEYRHLLDPELILERDTMPKTKNTTLLLLHPQNSFCKAVSPKRQQQVHDGELCAPGAWDDMKRVARLIGRLDHNLTDIQITMDSRQLLHISHPLWFRDAQERHPEPFTIMREEEGTIIGGRMDAEGNLHDVAQYTTTIPFLLRRTLDYLKTLEKGGRYRHQIWPPHCLIGTPGHDIAASIMQAALNWCRRKVTTLAFCLMGSNVFVEQLSAVHAEVPDPEDPTTQMNTFFIEELMAADEILVAGEPGSHMVVSTLYDIGMSFADDSFFHKCVLLVDGTSPLPGWEEHFAHSIEEMKTHGMRTTTCADYCA